MIYKGIKIRDNYMDKYIVDEMENGDYDYVLSICNNEVVLDLGANLGAFSKRALEAGALSVISVEPEPDNFKLLEVNTGAYDTPQSVLIQRAVSMCDNDTITLYVNNGNNKGLHTIMPDWLASSRPDCKKIEVQTISILSLLDLYKPSVLKVDIEGAENIIIDVLRNLPEYVKHIAIEFDTISNEYLDTIKALLVDFDDAQRNKFFTGGRRK